MRKLFVAVSTLLLMAAPVNAQDPTSTLPLAVGKVAPALEAYAAKTLFSSEWTSDKLAMRDRALVTFAA